MSWTWFLALFLLFSIRLAYLEYSGNRPLCACPLNHISISNWIRTVFRRMTWMHFLGKCLHTTWFSANKSTWRESISSNFPCSRRRVHVYKQPKHISTALPLSQSQFSNFSRCVPSPLSDPSLSAPLLALRSVCLSLQFSRSHSFGGDNPVAATLLGGLKFQRIWKLYEAHTNTQYLNLII